MAIFRKKKKKPEPVPAQSAVQEPAAPDIKNDDEMIESMGDETVRFEDMNSAGIMPSRVIEPVSTLRLEETPELDATEQLEPIPTADQIENFYNQQKREGLYQNCLYENGQKQFGEHIITGYHYYFDPEQAGHTASGLVDIPSQYALDGQDKTVYCSFNGNFMLGKQVVDGKNLYFDRENGAMVRSRLIEEEDGRYYYDAFGQQHRGIIKLDGKLKYFDQQTGRMATGITVIPAEYNDGQDKTVYFDQDGNMVFGFVEENGVTRCFDIWDGHMLTGLNRLSSEYGQVKTVYFDETGAMLTGAVNINGRDMYFARDGSQITNSTIRLNDRVYYYDQKGHRYHGPRYLKGNWKYFDDEDGHMLTGLVQLPDEDFPEGYKTVCYDLQGNMLFGPQVVDGTWKCFDRFDGHMFTGLTYLSEDYGGPKTVYYSQQGSMQTGRVSVDGTIMYFDEKGDLVKNRQVELDGNTYYFDEHGYQAHGEKCIDGTWKFFDPETGAMVTGLLNLIDINGKVQSYFYDQNGCRQYGMQSINGSFKYFDPFSGQMKTGLVHLPAGDGQFRTVYFNEDGDMVVGPRQVNGQEMFFGPDGSLVRNKLVEFDNSIYYYDQSGRKFHGQIKINGRWKLFDLDTGAMQSGLVHMTTRENPTGEKTVYFDENGDMIHGLYELDGEIKCFDLGTGEMMTGFCHLSKDYGEEKNCYFDENGSMVFGRQIIGERAYYFNEETGNMEEKPQQIRSWNVSAGSLDESQMKNNALLAAALLKEKGWSIQAVAGTLANMERLSKTNPGLIQGDRLGIFQLPESSSFFSWMESHGYEKTDGFGQIARLIYETSHDLNWKQDPAYPISLREFISLDFKPGYAAQAFARNYLQEKVIDQRALNTSARIWMDYLLENS